MVVSLPSRVMNYKVSAASPTDELVTLGQILSEVGDYASSILDRDHLSLTRKCGVSGFFRWAEVMSEYSVIFAK